MLAERRASSLSASTSQPQGVGAGVLEMAEGHSEGVRVGAPVEICLTVTLPAEVSKSMTSNRDLEGGVRLSA
jgi:hypothetical protein